ncbi:MAG: carboxypeptidase regulatory-like domain-containing protein, partial [Trueperella pyogenes]|nr:carboxypeptidase regulatory-like domain-containing protein [Trueperella pyogenes]
DSLMAACPDCIAQSYAPSGNMKASANQTLSLTSNVTLRRGSMSNDSQDWAFTGLADTAIKKAISDPAEVDQATFEFAPGKVITYTLTVTNNGPSAATGVKAADQLPAGVEFVKAEGDGSYDSATGEWDLSEETIAKGDVKTMKITVKITGEGAGTLITNVARITHQDQAGDDPTNNESSASFKGGFNIGGTLFRDSDASYSKSDTEDRFSGVAIALLDADGNPILDKDGKPVTTVTDADGNYQFTGLPKGTYRVSIVDPNAGDLAGLTNTQAYKGRGATLATVTISDASVQGVDFGFVKPATIGDRVWNDQDHNGVDNGEPGVPGVTVILKDASGNEVARTTTDANGNYRFEGILPGTYSVSIEVPAGYEAVATSKDVTVAEGEVNLDMDFPLTQIPAAPSPSKPAKSILAKTGSDAQWIAILTSMLLAAGVGTVGAARKRRD